ncbi:MAG: hypothetical protein Q4Q03_07120 [Bowdeniella nasicola]|nr:hypothetical protein [Bowdeniella nasicola]
MNTQTQVIDPSLLTMTLIHHGGHRAQAWWRSAVLYEYAFTVSEQPDLAARALPGAHSLGIDGVVLPSGGRPITASVAKELVALHHDHDLRIIPSLAPSRAEAGMIADAQIWLEAGADGIDMRSALAAHQVRDSRPFQALVASYLDDGLLAGSMRNAADLREHIAEHWLGHLRDDSLTDVAFHASAIRAAITENFTTRDALGATPAWTTTYALYRCGPAGDSWQADRMSPQRVRAIAMMVLALPGAVYLLQGEEVGMRDWAAAHDSGERTEAVLRAQRCQLDDPDSMFTHYRRLLHVRRRHNLGTGTVAWVDGLHDPQRCVQFLNRCFLMVLNTSNQRLTIPAGSNIVHASTPVGVKMEGERIVRPASAVMIELPPFASCEHPGS